MRYRVGGVRWGIGAIAGLLLLSSAGCAILQPKAEEMAMPPQPETRSASLIVEVEPADRGVTDYVQPAAHSFPSQASVVINVPSDGDVRATARVSGDGADSDFQTRNYYSAAEERIERELIRHGFRLLSRAKFEAKLREQRDAANCSPWYRCPERLNDELRAAVEDLNRDLEAGDITRVDYVEAMSDLGRSRLRSAGRSRQVGDDELVDMSEVIRAAQSGPASERADYILEINRFITNPSETTRRVIDLRNHPDVRRFRNNYPWADDAMRSDAMILECEQQSAELNAKLVEVESGQVVWIGSHRVTESMLDRDDHTLIYDLSVRERVANLGEVQNFVSRQNREEQLIARAKQPEPKPPAYQLETVLQGPALSRGQCRITERSPEQRDAVSTKLAQEVAETLIKTIRVGGL